MLQTSSLSVFSDFLKFKQIKLDDVNIYMTGTAARLPLLAEAGTAARLPLLVDPLGQQVETVDPQEQQADPLEQQAETTDPQEQQLQQQEELVRCLREELDQEQNRYQDQQRQLNRLKLHFTEMETEVEQLRMKQKNDTHTVSHAIKHPCK
ncbi:UNVERIFIED_CONTAM: hypothetical protein FKN15_025758 [Acipenser sinensis]